MLEPNEFPGSVLVRLGLGTMATYQDNKSKWKEEIQGLLRREPYELRVHVYQVCISLGCSVIYSLRTWLLHM